jgi:hypothetical protein
LWGLWQSRRNAKEKSAAENKSLWLGYDAKAEFSRMGLPGLHFRQTAVNEQYQLAPTYPSFCIVPKAISDEDLKAAAGFRAKGRFIAVTWKNPTSLQFIARSSQPHSGIFGRAELEDTKILNELAAITRLGRKHTAQPYSRDVVVQICDARPYVNALANAVGGKGGYEPHTKYDGAQLFFANIQNIHAVQTSFKGLRSLFTSLAWNYPQTASSWTDRYAQMLTQLHQKTGNATWLGHISLILKAAVDLASWIAEGGSVLIHCSDGWDRTAQLAALTQLLVDPYYRTIHGFCVLIEKEWIRFGHRFATRYGNTASVDESQESPIMIQWLDAVFQVLRQFPNAFEFNETMLADIADSLNSGKFGTFLGNSEQEYVQLKDRTRSLYYEPASSASRFIAPRFKITELTIFLHFFKRWDYASALREPLDENRILDEIQSRKEEAEYEII